MEATGGFEPPHRGFADLRLNRLATSPCMSRFLFGKQSLGRNVVPRAGFEPTQAHAHCPLKTACLPIPPPRPDNQDNIIAPPFCPATPGPGQGNRVLPFFAASNQLLPEDSPSFSRRRNLLRLAAAMSAKAKTIRIPGFARMTGTGKTVLIKTRSPCRPGLFPKAFDCHPESAEGLVLVRNSWLLRQ